MGSFHYKTMLVTNKIVKEENLPSLYAGQQDGNKHPTVH